MYACIRPEYLAMDPNSATTPYLQCRFLNHLPRPPATNKPTPTPDRNSRPRTDVEA